MIKKTGSVGIYWNRCYEPSYISRDSAIKQNFEQLGIEVNSYNGALLREPWQNLKKDDTPYRVFTPFWKSLHKMGPARELIHAPEELPAIPNKRTTKGETIKSLQLLPTLAWDKTFYAHWQPGEGGAWDTLTGFCNDDLRTYTKARDIPAMAGTSRLSAHLHFGEISPLQVWHFLQQVAATDSAPGMIGASEAYLRQIAWREFSIHLLYHFPHTPSEPLNTRFAKFPWRTEYTDLLNSWQQGQTGIPIIDAGMRELWATGTMHNRVRMIAASFLTKNLLIPWQEGARWFWDTLVDADLSNNTMGWQWVAGSGADAAPYFRIFNPILQGEKFDKNGLYIRQWVPELTKLTNKVIHKPWTANPSLLADANITLGQDYPYPLVDLQETRQAALAAWDNIKGLPINT